MKHRARCSIVARRSRARAPRVALRLLCLSCALVACVTNDNVQGGAYWGTKGAVQGVAEGVKELDDKGYLPDQRAMSGAVKEMANAAVTGAVTGAKDGIGEVDVDSKIKSAVDAALSTTDERLQAIVKSQTPLLANLVGGVVAASMSNVRRELAPTIQTDLPKATNATVKEAVDGFATSMQSPEVDKVQADIVKMTGEVTQTATAHAIIGLRTELAKEDTGKAVGSFARTAVVEAAGDLLKQWNEKFVEKLQEAQTLAQRLIAGIVGSVILLAVGLAYAYTERKRRIDTEALLAETKRALQFVVTQINEVETAGGGAVKTAIKAKAARSTHNEEKAKMHKFLERFLIENGL